MAELNEENKNEGVFGGATFEEAEVENKEEEVFTKVEPEGDSLPTNPSLWTKIRSFLFQEIDWTAPIKVELTPYQQKVEDEINEFLHQEISFKGFWNLVSGK